MFNEKNWRFYGKIEVESSLEIEYLERN